MLSSSLLLLSVAFSAYAAPSKRQSEDNGSCQALQTTCAASVKPDLSDAWNIKACVFGATCFGGQRPVDGFLAAVHSDRGLSGPAPASVNLPRVTTALFNSISTDGKTVSQQNFIDGFYSSLDTTVGPYPTNVQYVIDLFGNVQDWTAFCSSAVPFQNFADYFQYSSSVNSPGCTGAVTSRLISPEAVTFVSSAAATAATSGATTSELASAITVTSEAASAITVTSEAAEAVTVTSEAASAVTVTSAATALTTEAVSAVTSAASAVTTQVVPVATTSASVA
ncbi:hypothetical protein PENSPDRAFT_738893 [Peniophora sp. CONT]|nr:hypothetical protein PENSPDRAFT_738893 [Peniophora sp. CONT]